MRTVLQIGSFLAPLSVGIITNEHYLSERNVTGTENSGTNRDDRHEERDERIASKPE